MINDDGYRITLPRLLRTWFLNAVNGIVFVSTGGRRVPHEGRFRHGRWTDWARAFHAQPASYETPATEAEICRIVRQARKVRVVGAGHSFNAAPVTDETMISLDELDAVELLDHPHEEGRKIARVQAGIRLRELNAILTDAGWALSIAGSTDPQSIGGLIATDLHGTGRDHGFLSESLRSLRIVDAAGNVADHGPGDDVFHAAIGSIGTCGVVVGADIECEPAYNLKTAVQIVDRDTAEENIEALLAEHSHLSFYYFGGFARRDSQENERGLAVVRMNTWDRTDESPSRFLRPRQLVAEMSDLAFSGFLFDAARLLHIANPVARIGLRLYGLVVNRQKVVAPSPKGFARTLYFRHDEIEYGVPFSSYQECLAEVRRLLLNRRYPTIVEVRFTPAHSDALLGPGVGRHTAYLELASSMSKPTDPIFKDFEEIVLKYGGRAHLGKKTYIGPTDLASMYPAESLRRFAAARSRQDPDGKFLNPFAERLFGMSADVTEVFTTL